MDLSGLKIEDVEDVEIHPEVVVYRPPYGIFLSAPRKSFTVYAENKAEKQNWLELLTSTIKKAQEQKSRNISGSGLNSSSNEAKIQESPYKFAAGWVPDYVMRACPLCYTEFGFFLRRHHCRKCGTLVCDNCSKQKIVVPEVSETELVRICDICGKQPKNTK